MDASPLHDPPPLSILVVHGDVPPLDRDACSTRLHRIIELMVGDGHRVTVVGRAGFAQERVTAQLLRLGVERVFPIDAERAETRRGDTGHHRDVPRLDLAQLLREQCFDLAWLSLCDVAEQYLPFVRRHSPGTRAVVDSSDICWIREHRQATLARDAVALAAAAETRARERAVYGAADINVAISALDAEATRKLAPDVPVHVVPLIHPVDAAAVVGPGDRNGLVFVGNFRHAPNVDAIAAFHRTTWPLVRAALPDAHLTIVGNQPPDEVTALAAHDPSVTVTGWVPAVEPYLATARVSIAPVRYGAGVKGKIVESILAGIPVVSTTVGTEGMEFVGGEELLVADGPPAFAAAVAELHTDDALWTRIAGAGARAAVRQFGAEAGRAAVRAALAAAAPIRWRAPVDAPWVGDALAAYAKAFRSGDRAALVLTIPPDADPQAAYARVVAVADERGIDLDATADIELTVWSERFPLPGRTRVLCNGPATRDRPVRRAPGRRAPRAAVVLQAAVDPQTLSAQLSALKTGVPGDGVDVVIAAGYLGPDTRALLAGASGAKVIRCDFPPGRQLVTELGLQASAAPVQVVLGSLAVPQPGFVEPLLAAVQNGAALAAPRIGASLGLRVAQDGSLWPIAEVSGPVHPGEPDALPFDCLAARRDVWAAMPSTLPMREGHPERQLAAWAREHGRLAVASQASVERARSAALSVIVCSRNRADELPDVVALLVASGATVDDGEVVIVDNGSTDATPEIAADLAARHPGVRVVREERAGLSNARNAGAAAARNELIVYLDDDARPAPGWLESIGWGLGLPGVASAGGPIAALWPESRPADFPPVGLEGAFGVLDAAEAPRVMIPPEIVFGGNWAIRRSALATAGGFDPHLGFGPEVRIGSEEVAVAWRLHLRGLGHTLYVPGATVGHRIRADKLDPRFIVERMFGVGIEHAHLRAEREGTSVHRLTEQARGAAVQLLSAVPLGGDRTLEEALELIQRASVPVTTRTAGSEALGLLAATVLQLGETEVEAGGLRLRLRPEHLRGVLAPIGEHQLRFTTQAEAA